MKYLVQGMESAEKINCLLALTKIDSERKIKALHYHFVNGIDVDLAASMSSLPQPNLTEVIHTLNAVAEKCEKYHELRIYQLSGINKNKEIPCTTS